MIGTLLEDDRRRDCVGDTGFSDPAAAFSDECVDLWAGLLAEKVGTAVVALRDREDERAGSCASTSDATTIASSSELPGGGPERIRVFCVVLAFCGVSVLRFFASVCHSASVCHRREAQMPGCQQETTACPFASALFSVMTEMARRAGMRRTLAKESAWALPTYVLSRSTVEPKLG